jgi:hypothetical protein
MARYRKIDPRIWNDAKFSSLSDNGKLAFFMLLTHPSMTSLGAMRATLQGLAAEMQWAPEAFREAFLEASSKGMAEYDAKACLIALPKFIQYNQPESPNVVKAWVGALDLLPECDLKTLVIARARGFAEGMGKGFAEALPEAFAKAMPYQEPEQEQEPLKSLSNPAGLEVIAVDDVHPASEVKINGTAKADRIPIQKIVALYHESLPSCRRCEKITEARAGYIRQRWREDLTTIEAWGNFYGYVSQSSFLTGRAPGRDGKPPFVADIEFLTKPASFAKIAEGKYHQ